jgi:hypothetical protein
VGNGDFESWAKNSLKDKKLASKIRELASEDEGEKLRKTMIDATTKRYNDQSKQMQDATQLF